MIVCVCKAVNERAIRRAVAEGHDTFDAIQFELGVGITCGKCVSAACEVLCDARLAGCQEQTTVSQRLHFEPRATARDVALA